MQLFSRRRLAALSLPIVLLAGACSGASASSGSTTSSVDHTAPSLRERSGTALKDRFAGRDKESSGGERGVWASPDSIHVPVGAIAVPAIGLAAPFRLGVHDDVVQLGPGLWPGTPLPGAPGNAVFAGHRTTYTHPFGDLDLLRRGDVIRTRLEGGKATVFRVSEVAVVAESDYADYVLRQPRRPGARMLTLFACTPKGQRTHRIVVQAEAKPLESNEVASRVPDTRESDIAID